MTTKIVTSKINKYNDLNTIKNIVNVWEKTFVLKDKSLPLYKYIKYLKSVDHTTLIKQHKLESLLVIKSKSTYLHLLYTKNKIIKKYYKELMYYINNKFDAIFNRQKIEKNEKYLSFLKNNIDVIAFHVFEGIAWCVKNQNYYWSSLYSHVILYVKNSFKSSKYATAESIEHANIYKHFEYTANALMNSAESNKIIIKEKEEKNRKNKMSCIFKFNTELNEYINRIIINVLFKPPMIIKPKPWKKYIKNKIVQYSGGYFSNYFLKLNIDKDKYIKFNNSYISSINYMQEVPLSINQKYLSWIENSNVSLLVKHFNLNPQDLYNFMEKKYDAISINNMNILNEILSTLYYAKLFSKFKRIYLPMHYDFRGRLYCTSYPLHYYTADLFRGLYRFSTNITINEKKLYDFFLYHSDNPNKFIEIYKKNKEFYSNKHFHLYKAISLAKTSAMVGVDASSSTFQIQGIILKDYLMMELSNVLPNKTKKDIYKYVMSKLSDYILEDNHKLNLYMMEINNCHYLKYNVNVWETTEEFNSFINKLLKDREVWKAIIMRLGYNQMLKSRTIELTTFITDKFLKCFEGSDKNKYYNKWFHRFMWFLAQSLEIVFYQIFPKQLILKKLFSLSAHIISKRNENIKFCTASSKSENTHIVWQSYYKQKWYDTVYYSKTTKKKYHIAYSVGDTSQIDIAKTKISTLPNYIQYLDSVLMTTVVNRCKRNKLHIKCIHDNFLAHFKNINLINEFYIDAIINKLLNKEQDVLLAFIESNSLFTDINIFKLYFSIMQDFITVQFYDTFDQLVFELKKENINKFKKKYLLLTYKIKYLSSYTELEHKLLNSKNNFILSW
jgi:DNA-dependent RNA polymerase